MSGGSGARAAMLITDQRYGFCRLTRVFALSTHAAAPRFPRDPVCQVIMAFIIIFETNEVRCPRR